MNLWETGGMETGGSYNSGTMGINTYGPHASQLFAKLTAGSVHTLSSLHRRGAASAGSGAIHPYLNFGRRRHFQRLPDGRGSQCWAWALRLSGRTS